MTAPVEAGEPPRARIALDGGDAIELYFEGDAAGFEAANGGVCAREFASVDAATSLLSGEFARSVLMAFGTFDMHGELGAMP